MLASLWRTVNVGFRLLLPILLFLFGAEFAQGTTATVGAVTYQYTITTQTCLYLRPNITKTYSKINYSSFSYKAVSGTLYALPGGISATNGSTGGGNGNCPISGLVASPHPLKLSTVDGEVDFFALGFGGGRYNGPISTGSISPKYVVLGVVYNPPGPQSFVDYGTSTLLGTSTSLSSSFTNSVSETVTVSVSTGDLFGIDPSSLNLPNAGVSTSFSTTDTQEQDTSSSVMINKTSSTDLRVFGPTNGAAGLNHDFDLVKIWLNPVVNFKFTDASHVQVTSNFWDVHDPCDCMDIVLIPLIALKNPSLITDQNELNQLARRWASNLQDGSGPGLTNADLLAIAAADPFSDPAYSPTLAPGAPCTTDGRFCKSINTNVQYPVPVQGEGPITNTYSWNCTVTDTTGRGAKDTHSVGYTIDTNFSAGFLGSWSIDIKDSQTLTWVNGWSTLNTNTTGQSATASITGPKFADNYTGPTAFILLQDNVYNSFMFLPVIF